jgi:hypothetical protein
MKEDTVKRLIRSKGSPFGRHSAVLKKMYTKSPDVEID